MGDGVHEDDWYRTFKIKMTALDPVTLFLKTYLELSHYFTFAAHVPPTTPAASTDGVVIMAYHAVHGHTGMVFCRPGDAAWTKVANPNSEYVAFADFAYSESEGKMLALDNKGVTVVFDAETLEVLYQVDLPPATSNFRYKHSGGDATDEFSCLRLVAVPSKVLLVKICIKSSRPEGFQIFELSSGSEKGDGRPVWRKVAGGDIGGDHELFLDGYHATFGDDRDGGGTRIYYFHDDYSSAVTSCAAAYCYIMKDNMLERVYMPSRENGDIYTTRPSWFVPS
uniref:KIB1-4 beta-propeller domain-containing protein n=2 Tax=Aegilops tauschii TaxID=37682 RepID=A0A452YSB9_AEGTS